MSRQHSIEYLDIVQGIKAFVNANQYCDAKHDSPISGRDYFSDLSERIQESRKKTLENQGKIDDEELEDLESLLDLSIRVFKSDERIRGLKEYIFITEHDRDMKRRDEEYRDELYEKTKTQEKTIEKLSKKKSSIIACFTAAYNLLKAGSYKDAEKQMEKYLEKKKKEKK